MKNIITFALAILMVTAFQSCDNASANEASMLTGKNKTEKKASLTNAYKVGDKVSDFSLKNIDGEMVSMSDYADAEGFIVVFTCNTCPYSKMYEDRLKSLSAKYANDNWPLIAIQPNDPAVQPGDSYDEMVSYASAQGFNFPYLFDEGQKEYPKWGAARTPHVFIVEKTDDGNLLRYIGAADDNARDESKVTVNYVDKTIASIRAGETVDPDFTKAIGCTIKTK